MSTYLTPAQQGLLDAMRGGAKVYYTGAYYFRGDTGAHCTRQIEALIRLKLVDERGSDWRNRHYIARPQ